jgi:hypothetical protein
MTEKKKIKSLESITPREMDSKCWDMLRKLIISPGIPDMLLARRSKII